jgi:cytochrome b involved in lipid metabolism
MDDHPGGKKVIMAYAGRDASEEFNALHSAFPGGDSATEYRD